jgi:membrane-bound serine protease (ClpP class)
MMVAAILVVLLGVAGITLLAIEIFVIPGFGVVGVIGILALISDVALAWIQLGSTYGILALGGGVAATGLMLWLLPRTSVGKAMVLQTSHRGTSAAPKLSDLYEKQGRALTPLRPAGTAELDDRIVDVVTDGVYVEAGAAVRVVHVEGTRVVVLPMTEERS